MPDKLYQECHSLISGCRAIFEDLREAGIDKLPDPLEKTLAVVSSVNNDCATTELENNSTIIETLDSIQQEFSGCKRCTLGEHRTQIVFGAGNPNARLVLVGEAPDSKEDQHGEPFVGEAGQLLDRILFAMRLSRAEVYISNIVKCRPPRDRDPEKPEIIACETLLKRQLSAIAPEMILSLGRIATQSLLQSTEPISKLRGRWQTYRGIPVMPTFHPAYLLSNPAGKHQVWEDVKQVMHRLQDREG